MREVGKVIGDCTPDDLWAVERVGGAKARLAQMIRETGKFQVGLLREYFDSGEIERLWRLAQDGANQELA
jgi:hypothetical protein